MMAHENGGPMLANDKMRPPMPPAETLSPPRGDIPGVEDFLDETKVKNGIIKKVVSGLYLKKVQKNIMK